MVHSVLWRVHNRACNLAAIGQIIICTDRDISGGDCDDHTAQCADLISPDDGSIACMAQAQPAPPPLAGSWLAEDIRGGGVLDRLQSILTLAADGSISGTGGCNRMRGRAAITGDMISFGRIASTRMACTPAAMDQEQKFFAALSEVKFWRVDARQRKLILRDGNDQTLLIFSRM